MKYSRFIERKTAALFEISNGIIHAMANLYRFPVGAITFLEM